MKAMNDKFFALYQQAIDLRLKEARWVLDHDTWLELRRGWEWGSFLEFNPDTREFNIMGLECTFVHPEVPELVPDLDPETVMLETTRMPFCLYLRGVKPNCRVVQIDDPDCAEDWK